jgi:5-formyltetrahydrofolate cyclo-ligase
VDDTGRGTRMEQLKSRLRTSTLDARRGLAREERRSASAAVVDRLLALQEVQRSRTVLLFAAMPDEVDLTGMVGPLRQRNVRTLFPRVRGPRLELVAASDLLTLQLGHRGVREPAGPSIDPDVVDVAIIPGVAFDPHGGRLGMGGGHYDRLLAELSEETLRVGVCFACQVVPKVPREPHDEPVDLVVTERARYTTEARVLRDDA